MPGTAGQWDWGTVLLVVALSSPAVPRSLSASAFQCPDGAPPPCATARLAPPDPNRIAILPFHVTSADTLLGEGVAELLAPEFTGEQGPRAAHMGTVLRAWRRAGGDLRTPLGQARAMHMAREVDAGRYVEGTVVGLGSRITLSASVVMTAGGSARRVGPVSGPADSLELLVGRLAAGLLAAAGSERAASGVRLTHSPAAMRFYLEGLAYWRTTKLRLAATSFEHAFEQDSGFARASFMRLIAVGWVGGPRSWELTTWRLRARLSAADQLLLVGQLGADYPSPRSSAQELADLERAADQLPESAEAQDFVGDHLYHWGSGLDIRDAIPRARALFERSVALDSQATVLEHLLEIALMTGDPALAQRAWIGYDRIIGSAWDWGMAVAALRGDQAMLDAQRRRAGAFSNRRAVVTRLTDALIPGVAGDEIFDLTARYAPAGSRATTSTVRFVFLTVRGRPTAALRAAAALGEVSRGFPPSRDQFLAIAALFADGDSVAGADAMRRLALASRDTTRAGGAAACLVAFQDLRGPGTSSWNEDLVNRDNPRCGPILTAVRAVQEHVPDALGRLLIADSVSRHLDFGQFGFDRLALARAWEDFGDVPRALAVVRVRPNGGPWVLVEATRCREEGRLAALAGDTTGAIAAYRRYLALRQDAEPPLIPQRDSVTAALARLERRR